MPKYKSAELVQTEECVQYHIGVGPDDVVDYIMLVGDPGRADRAAKLLDEVTLRKENREFRTVTGKYKGVDVSIMSTGIGQDNIEIVFIELMNIMRCKRERGESPSPVLIRVGTTGGLQEYTEIGDLVISTGAVRLENTTLFFVPEGFPAIANYEVVMALIEAAERLGYRYHVGVTASASGFYGAQGRKIEGFPLRYPDLPKVLKELNVMNFEMESSALFTFATMRRVRAGMVCVVLANRPKNTFIKPEEKYEAERRALLTGLEAFTIIKKMDEIKRQKNKEHWMPSLSV